jgi:XTP/dITP diphosphohydrolase
MLATANEHKASEMRALLEPAGVVLVERPTGIADVDETEDTLEGNAGLKASALCAATGMAAIADDTGLFVDALDGRPGVWSARYAGARATYAENVERLLDELDAVPDLERGARFRTVICVAYPDGQSFSVDGALEGRITRQPAGENGFGYDPVFAVSGPDGRTLAQMSAPEKNAVSHRALALGRLVEELTRREVSSHGFHL